jgi:hypothetical protein
MVDWDGTWGGLSSRALAPKHRLAALATEADVAQAIAWAPKHRLMAIATVSLPRNRA